ncbi:hypothetical protein BU204_17810 [Actinophytocola xanthii]|uniref:Uncharacterized protein n=1 Tax=Actinophytocola xanthii TaxID=1912961 RepID=A0A1Q8CPF8_9PSEU|nr:hypothetical protein BU204_17810 [Actinophytocola xanthii]
MCLSSIASWKRWRKPSSIAFLPSSGSLFRWLRSTSASTFRLSLSGVIVRASSRYWLTYPGGSASFIRWLSASTCSWLSSGGVSGLTGTRCGGAGGRNDSASLRCLSSSACSSFCIFSVNSRRDSTWLARSWLCSTWSTCRCVRGSSGPGAGRCGGIGWLRLYDGSLRLPSPGGLARGAF